MNYINTARIPELLTVKQTAQRFGLSTYAVRQLIRSGKIVFIRPGGQHGPIYINSDKFLEYLNGGGDSDV